MTNGKQLTRDVIIKTLVDALKPLNYVHAFWEGGAVAFNRVDEWSDVDLYVVVDDEKADETFFAVEKALESLSIIKQKYVVLHPSESGISQAFYRLEDASEYLIIDLAVLTLSSPDKFLETEIHGNAVFYFNKSADIKSPPSNEEILTRKWQKRLEILRARFSMFNNFIQKEINRGNNLEAINLYCTLTLAAVVEALRIRHNPVHCDFKMRYIHYELPSDVITKLERLHFVRDEKELQKKYYEATEWFQEIVSQVEQGRMKQPIGIS